MVVTLSWFCIPVRRIPSSRTVTNVHMQMRVVLADTTAIEIGDLFRKLSQVVYRLAKAGNISRIPYKML